LCTGQTQQPHGAAQLWNTIAPPRKAKFFVSIVVAALDKQSWSAVTRGILTGLFLGAQPTRATTGLRIPLWAQPTRATTGLRIPLWANRVQKLVHTNHQILK
jgi:hypothetical protein